MCRSCGWVQATTAIPIGRKKCATNMTSTDSKVTSSISFLLCREFTSTSVFKSAKVPANGSSPLRTNDSNRIALPHSNSAAWILIIQRHPYTGHGDKRAFLWANFKLEEVFLLFFLCANTKTVIWHDIASSNVN